MIDFSKHQKKVRSFQEVFENYESSKELFFEYFYTKATLPMINEDMNPKKRFLFKITNQTV